MVGSQCNPLCWRGLCQKTCDLTPAATCRNNPADRLGDYECRAWQNVLKGVTSPLCDFGPMVSCADLSLLQIDCSAFGISPGNSTNMSCRGLDNVIRANPYATDGYCLDDTPCGSTLRRPAPDAGVPSHD